MTTKPSASNMKAERSVRPADGSTLVPAVAILDASSSAGQAPLAIASVTAVLRDLLANGAMRFAGVMSLGDVNVTVLPPDRVSLGAEEPNQLNLFMYAVTPHATLRKSPARHDGGLLSPTLALDLHYLVTAYGAHDYHSEILLGCAVHLLGRTPVLTRDVIRDALQTSPGKSARTAMSSARMALDGSSIADQEHGLKITQQFLSFEEMSKLWSVLQAKYRPSVVYEVSAVGISLAA
jgi:hypothetical protein